MLKFVNNKLLLSYLYPDVDGYEVEKYAYKNHTVEKIKTVKSIK